jgi:hypothetical protein
MPGFMAALRQATPTMGRLALQFVILTAARSGKVRNARWAPIDRTKKLRNRPADIMNARVAHSATYVATWAGFVYVAFVIDTYARRIVGWRARKTAHASLVPDALEQALYDRRPVHRGGLIHHSNRGSQYVSIKYTERLPKQASSHGKAASGTATTIFCGSDQRPLQGRGDPSTWSVAQLRSRRVRHARMGRLVQPPPPARTHWQQHVKDAEIIRRSSTRRAPGWFFGRCDSIAAQASSNNQSSAIPALP